MTTTTTAPTPAGLTVARRVAALKPSVTVAITNLAKKLQREGLDVLSFAAGEPDFDTPDRIKQSAVKALHAGQTKYMPTLGDPETRGVLAEKLTRENGIPGLTADHIAISAGGKHSLFIACHCLLDEPRPGEAPQEVLLPVPAWVSYAPIVELAGGKVVEVPTTLETGFKATAEQIAKLITPRTRMLILNSPSNPCGTMYTPDELRAIGRAVADAAKSVAPGLIILSDELYEKIVYGGIEHFSIGSMPEVADRTLTINGLSKAYAMTGWRIGYAAMPGAFGKKLIDAMGTLQGQMSTNITSFTYPAIRTAIREAQAEVESMRASFASRAKLITQRLSTIPGIQCATPTGAFYAWPRISSLFGKTTPGGRTIRSSMDFCEALLNEKQVAFVPGEDFGGCGGEHCRISFACSEAQISKGMDRLAEFVASLR